jgi:glutamine amidotransferase
MSSVAVIDYGMGNLHSIAKALQHADASVRVVITADRRVIERAGRVVFPGVGAIRECMDAMIRLDLLTAVDAAAGSKPLLGICLGLQALLEESEEGGRTRCLGLLPGRVVRFGEHLRDDRDNPLKIPHMGWNQVHQTSSHPLWRNIAQDSRFYFVHSYYALPRFEQQVAATSDYPDPFACALVRDNVFAVQFHPEKSQSAGLQLLANFLKWRPEG